MPPLSKDKFQDDSFNGSLPSAFSESTRLRRGLCPVTALQKSPESSSTENAIEELVSSHSLYYEQHGPARINQIKDNEEREREIARLTKVVLVMGLNSSCFSWGPQVKWFSGEERQSDSQEEYTVLAFDNRGVGNSGYPRGPYTTSGMADDVICLLDYLGWTRERDLNIIGISMGGMITQELACRIPKRIRSIVFAVTTPGGHFWNNLPPLKGVSCLAKLLITPDPPKKAPIVLDMLFPQPWLDQPTTKTHSLVSTPSTFTSTKSITNRDIQTAAFLYRFSITTPQRLLGHLSQMVAGVTHYVSREKLAYIARNVPKIIVVTGDEDHLVRPSGSARIWEGLTGAEEGKGQRRIGKVPVLRDATSTEKYDDRSRERIELIQWRGTGHAIQYQHPVEFNKLIERCIREGKMLVDGGFVGKDTSAIGPLYL